MLRSQNPELIPIDLEIERTLRRLRRLNIGTEVKVEEADMGDRGRNENENVDA